MSERKALSKRTRFEIFKRDWFRCVYCGATSLDKPLHVDHVQAIANGGDDDPANLVTACSDCNLGKSSVPLSTRTSPSHVDDSHRDHAEQIREYLAVQREVAAAKQEMIESLGILRRFRAEGKA